MHAPDFGTGAVTPLASPPSLHPRAQFNDGKVDRRGRFVVGTTDSKVQEDIGGVYSLSADPQLSVTDTGLTISNRPCCSPDHPPFYLSDSKPYVTYAYDYDIDTARTSNKRENGSTPRLRRLSGRHHGRHRWSRVERAVRGQQGRRLECPGQGGAGDRVFPARWYRA
ncbi:MAG: SMP-30/gluconolactonase/LRE family protein [Proteobacteria bacterium]|nr:SMP-30/gluconolactonase/LRE family protein [Pseudomonadota bacterium]